MDWLLGREPSIDASVDMDKINAQFDTDILAAQQAQVAQMAQAAQQAMPL